MKKKLILLAVFFQSTLFAAQWTPYQNASLNFAIPHPYAAKDTIINWYLDKFYDGFDGHEKELIDIIEANTNSPIYCTKLTVGSITSKFCNPWVIAIFIKDGKYYLARRRYKFFSTLNYMEILKMNLDLEDYDEFHKFVIPFASKYTSPQLTTEQKLVLSFYYMYDYHINDKCFDFECEHKTRTKRQHKLVKEGERYNSYSWIHRTLLSGCSEGGSCITARQITYQVCANSPTTWHSSATDTSFIDAWYGSTLWHQLNQSWLTGEEELENFSSDNQQSVEIPNFPLPK